MVGKRAELGSVTMEMTGSGGDCIRWSLTRPLVLAAPTTEDGPATISDAERVGTEPCEKDRARREPRSSTSVLYRCSD